MNKPWQLLAFLIIYTFLSATAPASADEFINGNTRVNARGWFDNANSPPATDAESAGATGAQRHISDQTWQDVRHMNAPGNLSAGVGRALRTRSQGTTDFNGAILPPSTTPIEASKSGMAGGIPTVPGLTLGFPTTGASLYSGAYRRGGNFGGILPSTSTAAVNADVVDGVRGSKGGQTQLAPSYDPNFPGADGGGRPWYPGLSGQNFPGR